MHSGLTDGVASRRAAARAALIWVVAWLAVAIAGSACDFGVTHCFVEGTLIWTPRGEIPIEDLRVGDEVYSFDHATGRVARGVVTRTWVHPNRRYSRLALPDGRLMGVTEDHPIFDAGRNRYVAASALGDGSMLLMRGEALDAVPTTTPTTAPTITQTRLETSLSDGGVANLYNLSVAGYENYFAQGVLVHNKSPSLDAAFACSLAEQVGCQLGEKCTRRVESADPLMAVIECVPAGSVPLDGACTMGAPGLLGYDDCAAGLYCEAGVCTALCVTAPDRCPAQSACSARPGLFPYGAGLCQPTCDVLTQDCVPGQACYLTIGDGRTSCQPPVAQPPASEPGQQGDDCEYTNSCTLGFGCTLSLARELNPPRVCARFCDASNLGGPTCAGLPDASPELTCVSINGFYEGLEHLPTHLGFCIDCATFPELQACQ